MFTNQCSKCGEVFETKNPKRVICPNCLYPEGTVAAARPAGPPPYQQQQPRPYQPTGGGYGQQGGGRPPSGGGYGPPQGGYGQQGGYQQRQPGYGPPRPLQGGRPPGGGYGPPRPPQGGYQQRQPGYGPPRPPQGGRPPGGGYGPPRPYQGGRPPGGGFGPPRGGRPGGRPGGGGPRMPKKLLVTKEQLIDIERLYKNALPLPNPDIHEVIGEQINLAPSKVFFGINLVREKMKLPKLEYPKRKLAVTPEQLMAIETLYEPYLPLPPLGIHKIISKQLRMDEWRVHVAIGLIRKNRNLNRWNEDRDDLPPDMKEAQRKAREEKEQAAKAAEKTEKSKKTDEAEKPEKTENVADKLAEKPKEAAEKPAEETAPKKASKAKTAVAVIEEEDEEAVQSELPLDSSSAEETPAEEAPPVAPKPRATRTKKAVSAEVVELQPVASNEDNEEAPKPKARVSRATKEK